MSKELSPCKRYLESDESIIARSYFIAIRKIREGDSTDSYFKLLAESANKKAYRLRDKVNIVLQGLEKETQEMLRSIDEENILVRDVAFAILQEEIAKREASKTGLVSYLFSERPVKNNDGSIDKKRIIDPKYVNPYTGKIKTDELKRNEYFVNGPGIKMLPILQDYRISKKSKIRKAAELEDISTWFTAPEVQSAIDSFVNFQPVNHNNSSEIMAQFPRLSKNQDKNDMQLVNPAVNGNEVTLVHIDSKIKQEGRFLHLKNKVMQLKERSVKFFGASKPSTAESTA